MLYSLGVDRVLYVLYTGCTMCGVRHGCVEMNSHKAMMDGKF